MRAALLLRCCCCCCCCCCRARGAQQSTAGRQFERACQPLPSSSATLLLRPLWWCWWWWWARGAGMTALWCSLHDAAPPQRRAQRQRVPVCAALCPLLPCACLPACLLARSCLLLLLPPPSSRLLGPWRATRWAHCSCSTVAAAGGCLGGSRVAAAGVPLGWRGASAPCVALLLRGRCLRSLPRLPHPSNAPHGGCSEQPQRSGRAETGRPLPPGGQRGRTHRGGRTQRALHWRRTAGAKVPLLSFAFLSFVCR